MKVPAVQPYLSAMVRFVAGEITAAQFEDQFNDPYLADDTSWPREVFDILDGVFAATDDYDEDPAYRAEVEESFSPEELRQYVRSELERLRATLEQ